MPTVEIKSQKHSVQKVILGMTISLDGFVNDRNGNVGRLYRDLEALRKTSSLQEAIKTTGAVVMGGRPYEMAERDRHIKVYVCNR